MTLTILHFTLWFIFYIKYKGYMHAGKVMFILRKKKKNIIYSVWIYRKYLASWHLSRFSLVISVFSHLLMIFLVHQHNLIQSIAFCFFLHHKLHLKSLIQNPQVHQWVSRLTASFWLTDIDKLSFKSTERIIRLIKKRPWGQ